jgi:hypothetical protein
MFAFCREIGGEGGDARLGALAGRGEIVAYARNECGRRREVMQEYTLFCAASSFS